MLTGGRAMRRTVRFGDSNFDFVQIMGGLRAGESVIVSDMKEHLDTPELRVQKGPRGLPHPPAPSPVERGSLTTPFR